MSNYAKIKNYDIANGDGIGVSIFFSGCDAEPKCKGCFNSDIWSQNVGQQFTNDTIDKILDMMNNKHICRLSVIGGDPLANYNIESTIKLVQCVKEKYPNKKVWLWTWRRWETFDVNNFPQNYRYHYLLKYIDVLIDGRFVKEEKDLTLKWCGSKNQRVIDVQESLKQNKIVKYDK